MKKSLTTLALAGTLVAGSAFADTTPVAGSSTASGLSNTQKILSRTTVTYAPSYYGPSISSPSFYLPNTRAGEAKSGTSLRLEHDLILGYKLSDSLKVDAVLAAYQWPVANRDASGNVKSDYAGRTQDRRLDILDPALRLSSSSILKVGGVNMAAAIRAYAPVSDVAKEKALITALRSDQTFTYDVPKSKLTLGLITTERVYAYSDHVKAASMSDNDGAADLRLYAGPNVNYQLTPKIGLTGLYEIETAKLAKDNGLNLTQYFSDIETGVSWDIMPTLNLNPVLNFKTDTGERLNIKTTSINLYATWKLL